MYHGLALLFLLLLNTCLTLPSQISYLYEHIETKWLTQDHTARLFTKPGCNKATFRPFYRLFLCM